MSLEHSDAAENAKVWAMTQARINAGGVVYRTPFRFSISGTVALAEPMPMAQVAEDSPAAVSLPMASEQRQPRSKEFWDEQRRAQRNARAKRNLAAGWARIAEINAAKGAGK